VKEKLKESERKKENIFLCSSIVNNIVSATSTLSLNELNQNKQQKLTHTSMTQQQKFTLVSTTQYLSFKKTLKNLCSREKTIVKVNTDVVHVTKHAK